jgi:perosamine synthetase
MKKNSKVSRYNIPITKVVFNDKDIKSILQPLKTGWVVQGKFVKEFEDKWCRFTGVKNSIAVTSGTTAIHMALASLGIKENDEVIIPSFTWIATANAVEYLKAKPVFCDINLDTFNIDVKLLKSRISKKTKAIIPVHLFGLPADMKTIIRVAREYKLLVIEDAACGFGSKYNNIHVGNFGDAGCFSFHPRKAITTGEGGIITTQNTKLARLLRSLRNHGAESEIKQKSDNLKPYLLPEFQYLGYNYRMTDIQASIGSSQMDRAKNILNRRIEIAEMYDDYLNEIKWLRKPFKGKNYFHSYQSYVCMFEPEKIDLKNVSKINKQRNDFMEYLLRNGIYTRPGTHSVHTLKYYSRKYNIKPEDFPNSLIADKCSIAFPLFPELKNDELKYIKEKITKYRI